ncbi:hypothetical protein C450_20921 [Halococcus salifodinae DSM 8989]|uniref:Uncharacterized protein n=1 Tax=Halococcus salifodinae DSM 8989 TaxID=1227456 RepID=M0MQA8_9EURY|nr:hypothetical protein C450_20921 [Halococcus salifodinae DSM 8989]
MSSNGNGADDGDADTSSSGNSTAQTGREVARRVFAREFNDATYMFKESDDELAPNYTLLPTGERANRLSLIPTHRNTAVSRTSRLVS